MSRVKVNEVTNKLGVGPVDFPDGITGVALTVTGNVTVGGTIISEDTTNVDSVGWVTARSGLNVGPPATGIGATIHANGDAVFAGVTTAPTFVGALCRPSPSLLPIKLGFKLRIPRSRGLAAALSLCCAMSTRRQFILFD